MTESRRNRSESAQPISSAVLPLKGRTRIRKFISPMMSHATKSTPSSAQSMVTVATVSPKIKTTMDEHVVDGEETCEPDETKAHTGQEAHETFSSQRSQRGQQRSRSCWWRSRAALISSPRAKVLAIAASTPHYPRRERETESKQLHAGIWSFQHRHFQSPPDW